MSGVSQHPSTSVKWHNGLAFDIAAAAGGGSGWGGAGGGGGSLMMLAQGVMHGRVSGLWGPRCYAEEQHVWPVPLLNQAIIDHGRYWPFSVTSPNSLQLVNIHAWTCIVTTVSMFDSSTVSTLSTLAMVG